MRILVLASSSPRRRALLETAGYRFEVRPAPVDESILPSETPDEAAERLARLKVVAAAPVEGWTLAADTIVSLDSLLLGKPNNVSEAVWMLRKLRCRWHQVTTGVAVRGPDGVISSGRDTTRVLMRDYADSEISEYVSSGDPLDKAGAYAIQSATFHPVEAFQGRHDTVVGLPLSLVERLLRERGYHGAG